MPTYEVFINGSPLKVELKRTEQRCFTANIAGKSFRIELPTDEPNFESEVVLRINGEAYRTGMLTRNQERLVRVKRARREATFKTEIRTTMKRPIITTRLKPEIFTMRDATPRLKVKGAITAPMTGKIVSVTVQEGEHVKEGQVACILEAMKMENEITIPQAGTVQKVHISKGASVSKGETLFVVR